MYIFSNRDLALRRLRSNVAKILNVQIQIFLEKKISFDCKNKVTIKPLYVFFSALPILDSDEVSYLIIFKISKIQSDKLHYTWENQIPDT